MKTFSRIGGYMERIEKTSVQTFIMNSIKSHIERNNLKAGDKLPAQAEMCEMLGVSRTSLREVLKALEARNVIEIVNGKGIYLKGNAQYEISARIEMKREKEDILEIFEVRKMLEREIIKLVVQRATEDELDAVQEVLDRLMEKFEKNEKSSVEDKSFHMKLYSICHNKLLIQLFESSMEVYSQIWEKPLGMEIIYTATIPYHKVMFDHIRKRDIKRAQAVNDKTLDMIIKGLLNT